MDNLAIKQRFNIIGNSPLLNRAIEIANTVAATDISVLITGESGVGKEVFPKIIHQLSQRKHGQYIAINCGAIPEGTIDSELFGHEKGSFTDAHEARKGYFEVANGGTIFLDEVAELPLSTQVRLLRVLESGEFLKVGSSKVIKTNVRIVAATNVNIQEAIQRGTFREDLYYRLSAVPIFVPPLRDRKDDIELFFKKFAYDFADKYRMPALQLSEEARMYIKNYHWYGNVRQLKNVTEQISIIETEREISLQTIRKYLPENNHKDLPVLYNKQTAEQGISEREILYNVLFEMKKDINDLKKVIALLMQNANLSHDYDATNFNYTKNNPGFDTYLAKEDINIHAREEHLNEPIQVSEVVEENSSLERREMEFMKQILKKHKGKRNRAAQELGISERTLYRKIKDYNLD
jgi:transcriptional regulator with PAS, ATPase and Fis domain